MIQSILLQLSGGAGGYGQFIMLGGMVVIFYLFFIRPQQKKQKDSKKFIEAIKKGDQIVTVGGIHGKVVSVDDNTVTVDVDRGSKLVLEKSSISLESSKKYTETK
ncbi:MAG: preprotein translocase subunit YajC [Cyclobacteriaceae bacterium]